MLSLAAQSAVCDGKEDAEIGRPSIGRPSGTLDRRLETIPNRRTSSKESVSLAPPMAGNDHEVMLPASEAEREAPASEAEPGEAAPPGVGSAPPPAGKTISPLAGKTKELFDIPEEGEAAPPMAGTGGTGSLL